MMVLGVLRMWKKGSGSVKVKMVMFECKVVLTSGDMWHKRVW